MATKTVKESVISKSDRKLLKCLLTVEEHMKYARELAEELGRKQAAEEELAAVKAEYKGKIEASEAKIRGNQRLVKDGYEHRWVDCAVESNMRTCKVMVTRKDTGEIIEDRPMTPDEKQLQIDFKDEDKEGTV